MSAGFERFRRQVGNPWLFRLFLLQQLPSAFFAGLKIRAFDSTHATVTVRYRWFTRNPFRSMYFAVQSMAAEMSTGLLASGHLYQRIPRVSMLVVGLEAKFIKRATSLVSFTCNDGAAIRAAIEESIATGEARTVHCEATGTDAAGETVSIFRIEWSFKAKT